MQNKYTFFFFVVVIFTCTQTTPIGDVFFGALSFAIAHSFSLENTMKLASFVAAEKCKSTSITGIPRKVPEDLKMNNIQ